MKRVIVNGMIGSSWRFKLKIFQQNKKMEYIDFEAEVIGDNSDEKLIFSEN